MSRSSACSMAVRLRRTPSCSAWSFVSRTPAVSSRRTGTPLMFRTSSRTSRVVPGTGVTIARSVRRSAFSRLDFPTFGQPTIAAVTPSRRTRPSRQLSARRLISARVRRRPASSSCSSIKVMSSSVKSIAASTCASMPMSASRIRVISLERAPRSCSCASLRLLDVLARMVSSTASACVRSRRPLRNARFVNSPGSASLAPLRMSISHRAWSTRAPPWQWISTTSSAVYERGARMTTTSTSSSACRDDESPVCTESDAARMSAWCKAWLLTDASGWPDRSRTRPEATSMALSPLIRTMPIPPSPTGVAMAQIVS